jgi:hypothetical protein
MPDGAIYFEQTYWPYLEGDLCDVLTFGPHDADPVGSCG